MSSLIRRINMFFISVILLMFYLVVIGIVSIIMKIYLVLFPKKESISYWQGFKRPPLDKKYFESEY